MSNCTSSCKTQDHASYSDCLKSNLPMFDGSTRPTSGSKASLGAIKADEKELTSYFDAVESGIEPRSTRKADIDAAVQISNEAGKAFDGINLTYKE